MFPVIVAPLRHLTFAMTPAVLGAITYATRHTTHLDTTTFRSSFEPFFARKRVGFRSRLHPTTRQSLRVIGAICRALSGVVGCCRVPDPTEKLVETLEKTGAVAGGSGLSGLSGTSVGPRIRDSCGSHQDGVVPQPAWCVPPTMPPRYPSAGATVARIAGATSNPAR